MAWDLEFERWIVAAALGLAATGGAQTINPGGGGSGSTIAATTTLLKGTSGGNAGVPATASDVGNLLSGGANCSISTASYNPTTGACTPQTTASNGNGISAVSGGTVTAPTIVFSLGPSATFTNPTTAIPSSTKYPGLNYVTNFTPATTVNTGSTFIGLNAMNVALNVTAPCHDFGSNDSAASGWCIAAGIDLNVNVYDRGIASGYGTGGSFFHYGMGDTIPLGLYPLSWGGTTQSADEGNVSIENQYRQLRYVQGTIASGGSTGSTLITTTIASNTNTSTNGSGPYNDGGPLLDVTQVYGGTVTLTSAATYDSTAKAQYYTFTGTIPASNFIGTLSACSPNGNGQAQAYITTTCTAAAVSGTPVVTSSASNWACAASVEQEAFALTAVTGSGPWQVTFSTKNAWNSPTITPSIMQGGPCTRYFANSATFSTAPVAYMAQGATSTRFYFSDPIGGVANGLTNTGNRLPSGTSITFYPGTEIIGTAGGSLISANLANNPIAWANGDTVVGTSTSELGWVGMRVSETTQTPSPCANGVDVLTACATRIGEDFHAFAPYGATVNQPPDLIWRIGNDTNTAIPALMLYYGSGTGGYRDGFRFASVPTNALFDMNLYNASGAAANLNLLTTLGTSGYNSLTVAAATGQMAWGSNFSAGSLTSTGATTTAGVNSTGPLNALTNVGTDGLQLHAPFTSTSNGPAVSFGTDGVVTPGVTGYYARIYGIPNFGNIYSLCATVWNTSNVFPTTCPLSVVPAGINVPSVGSGSSSNTDLTGELTFSSATSQTYTWTGSYTSHPEVIVVCQFNCNGNIPWVTYSSTTSFTINFASSSTGTVSYHAFRRN